MTTRRMTAEDYEEAGVEPPVDIILPKQCEACDATDEHQEFCEGCGCCPECCNCAETDCDCAVCEIRRELQ